MSTHETLGLLLVRDGLITRPQLYDALRLQRQNNRLLGTCLLSLGCIEPDVLLAMLSRQLAIPTLPRGLLERASPQAVKRVPREVALRLRIVPYSWDGEMLAVALADGRILNHLQEVAYHAQAAIGAYVALEMEIEAVLNNLYPDPAAVNPVQPSALQGRPRPPRMAMPPPTSAPFGPVTTTSTTTLKASPAPNQAPAHAPPRAKEVVQSEPPEPPRPLGPPLERLGFYEAVERVYDAKSEDEVGVSVGRALLNYFQRVLILAVGPQGFRVSGHAQLHPTRSQVPLVALPITGRRLTERGVVYGPSAADPRGAEVASVFGFQPGTTSLIAAVGSGEAHRLLVFADNGDATELYEDLHDVELLLKEAETGIGMLGEG